MTRFSWKNRETRYGPQSIELRKGGRVLAVVQEMASGCWFSYGMAEVSWNTATHPVGKVEAMKDALMRYKKGVK